MYSSPVAIERVRLASVSYTSGDGATTVPSYLAEPEGNPPRLQVSASTRVLAGVLVTIMVAAGIFPHRILEVAKAAARSLM